MRIGLGNRFNLLARTILKLAVHSLPAQSVARIAGRDLIAPCYHMITDESPVHTRHLYREVRIAEFESDLDHLLKWFTPLSLKELSELASTGERPPKRSFFLSFDDGFREMGEIVAPLCRKKGVPATFFLTTAFLDNRTLGFRHKASLLIEFCKQRGIASDAAVLKPLIHATGQEHSGSVRRMFLSLGYSQTQIIDECANLLGVDFEDYLRTVRPYLTGDQVAALIKQGFSIGGHSVDHPRYGDLSLHEQIGQTRDCMQNLTDRFSLPVKAFAFPFVSDGVDDRFFEEVFGRQIVDLAFCIGRMPTFATIKAFQRFGIESDERNRIQKLLCREVEGRLWHRLFMWKASNAA